MLKKIRFTRTCKMLILCAMLAPLLMGAEASNSGCGSTAPSSDDVDRQRQEILLKEAGAQVGMPAIIDFREKKLLKEILERRDKGLVTYTYAYSETFACYRYIGETIGYPLPYATQFTNPSKVEQFSRSGGYSWQVLPQADPNALFSPSSADATWTLMKNPNGKDLGPVYSEPKLVASPFKMADHMMCDNVMQGLANIIAAALKK